MNICNLFLKNIVDIITHPELDWITNHQSKFNRLQQSISLKLGIIIDSGIINIGFRLNS